MGRFLAGMKKLLVAVLIVIATLHVMDLFKYAIRFLVPESDVLRAVLLGLIVTLGFVFLLFLHKRHDKE